MEFPMTDGLNARPNDTDALIVDAFRYLEQTCVQVEALRRFVKAEISEPTRLKQLGILIRSEGERHVLDRSDWICRSNIDTFEIARGQGNSRTEIFCGFQVSLAPTPPSLGATFVPHIAVLLAANLREYEWEQWRCEEFHLDDEYLEDQERHEGDPWVREDDGRDLWTSTKRRAVAFVVPLTHLTSIGEVRRLVIEPFFYQVNAMRRLLTSLAT
jgi:hypothetical protein